MQIYDSLTRQKQDLKPVEPNKIRMYVCGITVYDFCHLGHARMLVSFDVICRWLRLKGYEVKYVRNITDIDDKIIKKAVATNKKLSDVTKFYTDAMHADERALGVLPPDYEPRATQHVSGMLEIIKKLESKGLAYKSEDNDVNFSVRKFEPYGKLSGRSLDDMRSGERVAVSEAKQDPLDFVLWKAAKETEPEDSKWESSYGLGRPGWHIECSAMSKELLGLPLDIHGGGPDLKFPHHENEIAQSEGAYEIDLARIWMHCGPLMVDNDKMSKSLGNFKTIRQTLAVGDISDDESEYNYNVREAEMLRFFIVRNHYRSAQNFTPDNLIDAQAALDRFYQTLSNFDIEDVQIDWSNQFASKFKQAMDDDFNTSLAISILFELNTEINKTKSKELLNLLVALGRVLGIFVIEPKLYFRTSTRYSKVQISNSNIDSLSDSEIEQLILDRKSAKTNKNFKAADEIREKLKRAGIELEDKPGGITNWRRT
ncbi:cysteine--tRNA ligase [Taylorella asinigenitalis]|uniref:Cysteine--tRNA ligase n=1 Tax=Taylorella asinigenitalis (strain MCE3) TaxID=1008459 RepID=G4QAV8_TAYAM|nr:cysteine--tRNA ligase [Taylorella asinigenitalis]AEP36418.1 Cysteinyl-tRNA synthetase [Taylorella asinigenitalis MCE3]